ncbi:MAG: HIT family protein [Crocinitomicaceae bacterium]|nr:HIT family protein [Crocinitomicaceae bacterium]
MATIFSRIIAGEIPSYKIAEDDKFYAFLDVQPVVRGHTLVIPKKEVDYFFDLDKDYLAEINLFARDVAGKIQRTVPCLRVGVAIVGLEVPHAHIHLIPLNKIQDINFSNPRVKMSHEEFEGLAEAIRNVR